MGATPTSRRAWPGARRLAGAGVVALLALGAAGCGDDDGGTAAEGPGADGSAEAAATTAEPTATGAWARSSAAGQGTGAAYVVLTGGAEDDRLVGAAVPAEVAGSVELHETVAVGDEEAGGAHDMDDADLMTMEEAAGIDVPAGATVELAPGGSHLMLVDLAAPLVAGDTFAVDLSFAGGATLTVTAEVRDR
jgi:copper(I)-binding protein